MGPVKVCPECGYAYEPQVTTCPECSKPLVATEEAVPRGQQPPTQPAKLVSAYRAGDQTSLIWAQAALREEGIRAFVRSFEVPAYDDVFVHPSGAWGEVLVAEEDLPRAKEIIEVITTGEIVPPEDAEQDSDS